MLCDRTRARHARPRSLTGDRTQLALTTKSGKPPPTRQQPTPGAQAPTRTDYPVPTPNYRHSSAARPREAHPQDRTQPQPTSPMPAPRAPINRLHDNRLSISDTAPTMGTRKRRPPLGAPVGREGIEPTAAPRLLSARGPHQTPALVQ
nr:MAG TPA: hypothetical protein [Caudoviricetes sp.]